MFKRFGKVMVKKNGKVKLQNKLRSLEMLVQGYKQHLQDERMHCQTITDKLKKTDDWVRRAKRFIKLAIRWTKPWLSREKVFLAWKDLPLDGCLALWQLDHESNMRLKQSEQKSQPEVEPENDEVSQSEQKSQPKDEPQSGGVKKPGEWERLFEPQSDLKMEKRRREETRGVTAV